MPRRSQARLRRRRQQIDSERMPVPLRDRDVQLLGLLYELGTGGRRVDVHDQLTCARRRPLPLHHDVRCRLRLKLWDGAVNRCGAAGIVADRAVKAAGGRDLAGLLQFAIEADEQLDRRANIPRIADAYGVGSAHASGQRCRAIDGDTQTGGSCLRIGGSRLCGSRCGFRSRWGCRGCAAHEWNCGVPVRGGASRLVKGVTVAESVVTHKTRIVTFRRGRLVRVYDAPRYFEIEFVTLNAASNVPVEPAPVAARGVSRSAGNWSGRVEADRVTAGLFERKIPRKAKLAAGRVKREREHRGRLRGR